MICLDCFPYITVWYVDSTTCPVGRFGTIGIYLEAGGDLNSGLVNEKGQ